MEPLNPGHQPQRFFHYSEQEDGKGFTIPGTDYVFKFDRFGGWFDEYQNYYNQDGEPDSQPPSESDSEHYSSENGDYFSQGSSSEDEYENSYGPPKELPLEQEDRTCEYLESRAANSLVLQKYPACKPLRVKFSNASGRLNKREFLKAYQARVKGILNVVVRQHPDTADQSSGYFVVEDADVAEDLIPYEGVRVYGRELFFLVDSIEEFMLDPIREDELKFKAYCPKDVKGTHQENSQFRLVWKDYIFDKAIFQCVSDFKAWINEKGFNLNEHYGSLHSVPNDNTKIKVSMSEDTFKAINGQPFEGKPVVFLPLQL